MKYLILILVLMFGAACTVEQTNEGKEDDMGYGELEDGLGRLFKKYRGWSASGTLTQAGHKEVSLQADFPVATDYTAQFKISGDLRFKQAIAEITWSVEGNAVRRRISVADGVSIQGAGQAISIKIRDDSSAVVPGIPTDYTVSVQVVPGTRGSTSNPPTLKGDAHILVGASALNLNIPQDSGIISVAVLVENTAHNPIPDQAISVRQQDSAGLDVALYDPRQYFWVPLQGSATVLRLENNTADTLIFTVIYGVDG